MSLTINGLVATSMRWLAGWCGPWVAELPLSGDIVPTGPAIIASTTGIAARGTIDAEHSGEFAEKRFVRVIGGNGGWSKVVRAQPYHSDIGLRLDELVTTTAAEVGEAAVVLLPKMLGIDFARREDVASQIFADAGVDWWVGLDGVTKVGIRPPLPSPTSLLVLDWDPAAGTVSFQADALVEPGTVVVDPRFGRRVVREVEANVANASVTGTLWLVEASPEAGTVSEFVDSISAIARRATRIEASRLYEYRVIAMAGDRVQLQAISPGMPDLLPTSIWAGASGYKAKLRPSSTVLVGFREGKMSKPYVAFYEAPEGNSWRPVELELDALASLQMGAKAVVVALGDLASAKPIARAPAVVAHAKATKAAFDALQTSLAGVTGTITGTALATMIGTLSTAIGTANDALSLDCPSAKVVSS
ncbi:hypothetical protein AKJ09_09859 [Labilithrix luteola]|uniref:Uncharacterized protein n=1 Tax=Labilithrix luteola TaxID=1391654 RepID=A0A0K1QBN7_9BACT|nr:hypothetical protein [Labilithrix luteola]AKV03196.1 hypothetical protein AKJ09_09859 [Labilithrix luteola]